MALMRSSRGTDLLKLLCLFIILVATNHGVGARLYLLWVNERWGTLIPFTGLWVVSVMAFICAAFDTSRAVRAFWGVLTASAGAIAFIYHRMSDSELSPFDALSLWSARHEAGRALSFYYAQLPWFGAIFAVGLLATIAPPHALGQFWRTWLRRLRVLPVIPVAAIAAIMVM